MLVAAMSRLGARRRRRARLKRLVWQIAAKAQGSSVLETAAHSVANGPILPFAAPHYFDRCWGKAEMTMAHPERRGKLRVTSSSWDDPLVILQGQVLEFGGSRHDAPQFGGVRLPQSGAADCRFGQRYRYYLGAGRVRTPGGSSSCSDHRAESRRELDAGHRTPG